MLKIYKYKYGFGFLNCGKYVYLTLVLFALGCVHESDSNQLNIEQRNNGLTGDQIISYHVNPTDSNLIYLNCANRVYKTINRGKDWFIDSNLSILPFGHIEYTDNAMLHYISNKEILRLSDDKWSSVLYPDSLKYSFHYIDKNGNLKVVFHPKSEGKSYSAYISDSKLFEIKKIKNESIIEKIKTEVEKHERQKYQDTTVIDILSGQILIKDESSGNKHKRMNGINRPEILGFLQDSTNPNYIYAIQLGSYQNIFGGFWHKNHYYIYESKDFGAHWNLADSSTLVSDLIKKHTGGTVVSKSIIDSCVHNNVVYSELLEINKELLLTRNYDSFSVLNRNDSLDITHTAIGQSLISRIGNIEGSLTYKKNNKVYGIPTYAVKTNEDTLSMLVKDREGGILLLTMGLDN